MKRTLVGALVVLMATAATACERSDEQISANDGPDATAEDTMLAEFEAREPLTSCGDVVFAQGDEWIIPSDKLQCLEDGFSGPGAELMVTVPTTEGDPIRHYFRATPASEDLDVYIDATDDAFGAGVWYHEFQTWPPFS